MRNFVYPAKFEEDPEAGGYVITFRDLQGAVTQGDDLADALAQASDCLDEAIAFRIATGREIREPSKARRGERMIPVPPLTAAKAALHLAARRSGISNLELARRLGCDEKEVRRMLDPKHRTKIARIEQALAVLGQRLVVGVEDAA